MGWWQELKRRNVVRVAVAYAVTAWVLVQLGLMLFSTFGAPAWVSQVFITLFVLLFPVALIFAWAFELTPEGIRRTHKVDPAASITGKTGRKLNFIIISALTIAVVFLVVDKFTRPAPEPANISDSAPAVADGVELTDTAGTVDPASIAVLPFTDMSPKRDQEYFADGISEELLNLLARLKGLKVAARTSSFAFKGRNEDVKDIAEVLGVANVLEGSVRKSGTTLRITAQLIDAGTGYHLWTETYDRELDDVFAIQDEIAAAIVVALKDSLGLDASAPTAVRSNSVDAYGAYLEGRYLVEKRTQAALEQAAVAFEKAIALDPDYAPAYAALAETTILLSDDPSSYGDIPVAEATERAEPLVERALALAPDAAESHVAQGFLLDQKQDFEGAVAAYDQALAINPNLVRAHFWRANAKAAQGRTEEQLESLQRAVALDPLSFVAVSNWAQQMAHRNGAAEARPAVEKLVRVRNDTRAYQAMANLLSAQGQLDEAHQWYLKALEKSPGDRSTERRLLFLYSLLDLPDKTAEMANSSWELPWTQFVRGEYEAAATAMQKVTDETPIDIYRQVSALLHLHAGNPAAAREQLEPLAERTNGLEGPLFVGWQWPAAKSLVEARQKTGDKAGAEQLLSELQDFLAARRATGIDSPALDFIEAQAFALSGDKEKALQRLQSIVDSHSMAGDLARETAFDNFHGDPEYERILADYQREQARQRDAVLAQLGEQNRPTGGTGVRY